MVRAHDHLVEHPHGVFFFNVFSHLGVMVLSECALLETWGGSVVTSYRLLSTRTVMAPISVLTTLTGMTCRMLIYGVQTWCLSNPMCPSTTMVRLDGSCNLWLHYLQYDPKRLLGTR